MSTKRIRKNVILSSETIKRGKQIAQAEKRSFSGVLEVSVDEAHKRIFGKPKHKQAA
jgi:hypothetical protein